MIILLKVTVTLKCRSQWVGHYDTGVLQNRFLNSHEGYRLTLVGVDQSGNDLQIPTVNMTVNGYFQIQKFKFRKYVFLKVLSETDFRF